MESLHLHIEYLLTRHDCVIVPGIGAFIASETEAYVDMEKGIITPRRREISFNSSVVSDDGLLSHSIARRNHLSFEEAHRHLTAMTEKLRGDLQQEGEVSLGMVGKLLMDSEGYVSFRPRRSRIQSDILPDILLISSAWEYAGVEVSNVTIQQQKTENCQLKTDDYYVFRIHKKVAHAAAMLVMILTVGLSLMIPINHDNQQKASVVPIPEIISIPESMSVPETISVADYDEVSSDSIVIDINLD